MSDIKIAVLTGLVAALFFATPSGCKTAKFSDAGGAAPAKNSSKNAPGCGGKSKRSLALADQAIGPPSCKISKSADAPKLGSYAWIATQPAPCDFILPTVTIKGLGLSDQSAATAFSGQKSMALVSMTVPVGTYWHMGSPSGGIAGTLSAFTSSHDFPTTPRPASSPVIDNGFILIQPDHKSYLLFDFPMGSPSRPNYKTAAQVANLVSNSLGFGDTKLLQPSPGSAANGYRDATVFAKGSVIILYDDTPDMVGSIEVDALLQSAQPASAELSDRATDQGADTPNPHCG